MMNLIIEKSKTETEYILSYDLKTKHEEFKKNFEKNTGFKVIGEDHFPNTTIVFLSNTKKSIKEIINHIEENRILIYM